MQKTHYCNGKGLVDFPFEVKVKPVEVWFHDGGMISTHDYSCPCCRKKHAVLDHSTGIMQPCWGCQKLGYRIVKIRPQSRWKKLLGWGD